jgi:AsmA protein
VRLAKWIAGSLAALAALLVLAVFVLTALIDANRFKGRVERLVQETSGQPFRIDGDLDITWYPWLALRMGQARLGGGTASAPLIEWRSASVGARLIPLIRGRLEVSRVRFDGLHAHLVRGADGHGNWEPLLEARAGADSTRSPPQVAGFEIRNGTIEYVDASRSSPIVLTDWKLDAGAWQPGKPLAVETSFKLQGGAVSGEAVPAVVKTSGTVASTQPLQATGELSIQTASLRTLLDQLAIAGPRPSDPQVLRPLKVDAQWALADGAFVMKPIAAQLDDTAFHGQVSRPQGANPILRFDLVGDRIALDRYVQIEKTSAEPFELPTAELKALRITGVLSFAEARVGGATVRNARIRLETDEQT